MEQGILWADMIVPGATLGASLLGASLAFCLHRGRERKKFKRLKAEQLLSELISLERVLNPIRMKHDINKQIKNICEHLDYITSQCSVIEALTESYFPELKNTEEEYFDDPDDLFKQMYSFFSAATDSCKEAYHPAVGEMAVNERKIINAETETRFSLLYSNLKDFRKELSGHIKKNK